MAKRLQPQNYSTVVNSDIVKCTNKFLKHVEDGNIKLIQKMLSNGHDVDCVDAFGWSALMCAAYAGQTDVVKLLISNGADIDKTDRFGQNAMDYAKIRSRPSYEIMRNHKINAPSLANVVEEIIPLNPEPTVSTIFCDSCNISVNSDLHLQHQTSTLHLFNDNKKLNSGSKFKLTTQNIGFRMLLRSGWDGDSGLGSDQSGRRVPVKAVVKHDRRGLGFKSRSSADKSDRNAQEKPRKQPPRKLSIAKAREKNKEWERNMRRYFSSDD